MFDSGSIYPINVVFNAVIRVIYGNKILKSGDGVDEFMFKSILRV